MVPDLCATTRTRDASAYSGLHTRGADTRILARSGNARRGLKGLLQQKPGEDGDRLLEPRPRDDELVVEVHPGRSRRAAQRECQRNERRQDQRWPLTLTGTE